MAVNVGRFPGTDAPKTILQNEARPQVIEKATGQIYLLIRDDVAANGKLYIAPAGRMTEMRSIKPPEFHERFEWYTAPNQRPQPVLEFTTNDMNHQPTTADEVEGNIRRRGGRPKGSKDKKPRARRTATKPTE